MSARVAERRVYLNWAADLSPDHVPVKEEKKWLHIQQRFTTDGAKGWQELRRNIEESRNALAGLLHIPSANNIIFSTGTLGGLQMLTQAFRANRVESILHPGDEIVVTDSEFPFLYELLHGRYRLKVARIRDCKTGAQIAAAIAGTVSANTKLVFFSHVLYRDGALLPLGEISSAIRSAHRPVLIAVDGSQALGQVEVNLAREQCDFYMGDTHKWIQGPNNVGFLFASKAEYVKKLLPLALNPLATAQDYQRERHSCTKSGIVAFAVAAARSSLEGWLLPRQRGFLQVHNRRLSGKFLARLEHLPQFSKFVISPVDDERRTGIVSFDFGQLTRPVYQGLRKHHVMCTMHEPEILPEFRSEVSGRPVLRLSFSDRWNTEEDVRIAADVIQAMIEDAALETHSEDRPVVYGA